MFVIYQFYHTSALVSDSIYTGGDFRPGDGTVCINCQCRTNVLLRLERVHYLQTFARHVCYNLETMHGVESKTCSIQSISKTLFIFNYILSTFRFCQKIGFFFTVERYHSVVLFLIKFVILFISWQHIPPYNMWYIFNLLITFQKI